MTRKKVETPPRLFSVFVNDKSESRYYRSRYASKGRCSLIFFNNGEFFKEEDIVEILQDPQVQEWYPHGAFALLHGYPEQPRGTFPWGKSWREPPREPTLLVMNTLVLDPHNDFTLWARNHTGVWKTTGEAITTKCRLLQSMMECRGCASSTRPDKCMMQNWPAWSLVKPGDNIIGTPHEDLLRTMAPVPALPYPVDLSDLGEFKSLVTRVGAYAYVTPTLITTRKGVGDRTTTPYDYDFTNVDPRRDELSTGAHKAAKTRKTRATECSRCLFKNSCPDWHSHDCRHGHWQRDEAENKLLEFLDQRLEQYHIPERELWDLAHNHEIFYWGGNKRRRWQISGVGRNARLDARRLYAEDTPTTPGVHMNLYITPCAVTSAAHTTSQPYSFVKEKHPKLFRGPKGPKKIDRLLLAQWLLAAEEHCHGSSGGWGNAGSTKTQRATGIDYPALGGTPTVWWQGSASRWYDTYNYDKGDFGKLLRSGLLHRAFAVHGR